MRSHPERHQHLEQDIEAPMKLRHLPAKTFVNKDIQYLKNKTNKYARRPFSQCPHVNCARYMAYACMVHLSH